MKYCLIILICLLSIAFFSCNRQPSSQESNTSNDSISEISSEKPNMVYAEIDTVFNLNDTQFKLNIKQLDITESSSQRGDTLNRPVYAYLVKFADIGDRDLFQDSLLCTSWGYNGKFLPIEAYEIAFPQINTEGSNIILSFKVFEQIQLDAIEGILTFNTNTYEASYSWKESFIEE